MEGPPVLARGRRTIKAELAGRLPSVRSGSGIGTWQLSGKRPVL